MLVYIFISLVISWWQGKMVLKATQTHGTTEGHWVKHVRWILLPAGYWRTWIIVLSVLRVRDGTEFFEPIISGIVFRTTIWKSFSFLKETSSLQAQFAVLGFMCVSAMEQSTMKTMSRKTGMHTAVYLIYAVSLTDKPILSNRRLSLKQPWLPGDEHCLGNQSNCGNERKQISGLLTKKALPEAQSHPFLEQMVLILLFSCGQTDSYLSFSIKYSYGKFSNTCLFCSLSECWWSGCGIRKSVDIQ